MRADGLGAHLLAQPADDHFQRVAVAAVQAAGIDLPHYSGAQWAQTDHIAVEDLQPGDLVFFYGSSGRISAMAAPISVPMTSAAMTAISGRRKKSIGMTKLAGASDRAEVSEKCAKTPQKPISTSQGRVWAVGQLTCPS